MNSLIPEQRRPLPERFDPATVGWSANALQAKEWFGIGDEIAGAVLSSPQRVLPDTTSEGNPAVRLSRGDVVITVGLRDSLPMVLHIRLRQRQDERKVAKPGGAGTTIPTTMRGLKAWIVSRGLKIRPGGHHDKVIDPQRDRVVTTIPSTPSDKRSIPNAVATIRRYLEG